MVRYQPAWGVSHLSRNFSSILGQPPADALAPEYTLWSGALGERLPHPHSQLQWPVADRRWSTQHAECIISLWHVKEVYPMWVCRHDKQGEHAEFIIDETFGVPGVGTVIAGTVKKGCITTGSSFLLGPDVGDGTFKPCAIKSIHYKRLPVQKVGPVPCCAQVQVRNCPCKPPLPSARASAVDACLCGVGCDLPSLRAGPWPALRPSAALSKSSKPCTAR